MPYGNIHNRYFRRSLWTVCLRSCLQNFFNSSFGAPSAVLTFVR